MKRFLFVSLAVVGVMAAAPSANATLLAPGVTVGPPISADANPLAATILANTGVQAYSVTGVDGSTLVGTGQAWVVTGFAGNPFGAGFLTFVYQVTLTSGTTATGAEQTLERVTASSMGTFSTDVANSAVLTQISAATADRTANGTVVGFNFIPPGTAIPIGGTSALLIINTNAPLFVPGTLTVQDGLTANMRGFSPTLTPEPSSLAIAGLGALGFVGYGLRRRKPQGA
jgi:hypothetical protein